MVSPSFFYVLAGALASLLFSFLAERLLEPTPRWCRPICSWGIHTGLWFLLYAVLVLLAGRPVFVAALLSFGMLLLVLINNVKRKTLREPLVFEDYDYLFEIIQYPRFYIPFFGWTKTIIETLLFLLIVLAGFYIENIPSDRFSLSGQFGMVIILLIIGIVCLLFCSRKCVQVGRFPDDDLVQSGFLANFWHYARASQQRPTIQSPFSALMVKMNTSERHGDLPHLVAVQSESFFDPRPLFDGIRPDILTHFDQLNAASIIHGDLSVPAWGANTIRTEFSFLTGIDNQDLGVHRFNPFRTVAANWDVISFVHYLKGIGYHTVCIHPYLASFYRRHKVYPKLGFDEFIDIRSFGKEQRFGPYISDLAVAEKISGTLHNQIKPIFIFAITMENHGPLHLEKINTSELDELYTELPPENCHDLSIYLRHLQQADKMIEMIKDTLLFSNRPGGLCWFGDHVPIMPSVYDTFGTPEGDTHYSIWSTEFDGGSHKKNLEIQDVAVTWLDAMRLM